MPQSHCAYLLLVFCHFTGFTTVHSITYLSAGIWQETSTNCGDSDWITSNDNSPGRFTTNGIDCLHGPWHPSQVSQLSQPFTTSYDSVTLTFSFRAWLICDSGSSEHFGLDIDGTTVVDRTRLRSKCSGFWQKQAYNDSNWMANVSCLSTNAELACFSPIQQTVTYINAGGNAIANVSVWSSDGSLVSDYVWAISHLSITVDNLLTSFAPTNAPSNAPIPSPTDNPTVVTTIPTALPTTQPSNAPTNPPFFAFSTTDESESSYGSGKKKQSSASFWLIIIIVLVAVIFICFVLVLFMFYRHKTYRLQVEAILRSKRQSKASKSKSKPDNDRHNSEDDDDKDDNPSRDNYEPGSTTPYLQSAYSAQISLPKKEDIILSSRSAIESVSLFNYDSPASVAIAVMQQGGKRRPVSPSPISPPPPPVIEENIAQIAAERAERVISLPESRATPEGLVRKVLAHASVEPRHDIDDFSDMGSFYRPGEGRMTMTMTSPTEEKTEEEDDTTEYRDDSLEPQLSEASKSGDEMRRHRPLQMDAVTSDTEGTGYITS